MSFKKRGLSYKIELNRGGLADSSDHATFDNGADKLTITGIRSAASIQSWIGGNTASGGHALLQLWGMKPSDMAQLSTLGFNPERWNKNKITVFAYDLDNEASKATVFSGGILPARINYNAMPDVSLELECYSTIGAQLDSISATSLPGSSDVAAMLQGICAACNPPLAFVNNGATATLSNPSHAGSAFAQINSICCAAAVPYTLDGDALTIWPRDTNVDGTVIETSPDNGMVGYLLRPVPRLHEISHAGNAEALPVRVSERIPGGISTSPWDCWQPCSLVPFDWANDRLRRPPAGLAAAAE